MQAPVAPGAPPAGEGEERAGKAAGEERRSAAAAVQPQAEHYTTRWQSQ